MSRPAPVRPPDRSSTRLRRALLPALLAALLVPSVAVRLQEEEPEQNPLSFEDDDGVRRLLREAETLERSGRWREALGRYRRAMARNPDHLCPLKPGADTKRYAGTGEYIARRIAAWPTAGIEAYRAEYDAPAQGLFEAYRKDGRTAHLETIVNDYFFTSLGDDAAHLLAIRRFDAGRVAEAARLWDRLLRLYPAPGIPRALLAARLAMARRLLGEGAPDADLPARLAGGPVRLADAALSGQALADAIAGLPVTPVRPGPGTGSVPFVPPDGPGLPAQWLDRPDRPRTRPEDPRLLSNDLRLWKPLPLFAAPGTDPSEDRARRQQMAMFAASMSSSSQRKVDHPFWPAAARDRDGLDVVIVQNGRRIFAFDPGNGRLLWRNPPSARDGDRASIDLLGSTVLACVADGRRVYANMMLPPGTPGERQPVGFAIQMNQSPEGPRTIRCYDIPTGRLLWDAFGDPRRRGADGGEARPGIAMQFPSPVAVGGGRVYAAALVKQNDHEVYICAFDDATGALLWRRYLASAPRATMGWRGYLDTGSRVPCVAEAGGVVYCLTNIGAVAALNGADGRVLWLARYPGDTDERRHGRPRIRPANPPAVNGSRVVVVPQDAAKAFRFDARTGALEESFGETGETPYLLGIHPVGLRRRPAVLLAGRQFACHFLDGARRDPGLSQPDAVVVARGAVADGVVYLPMRDGLLRYDLATLKIIETTPRPWVSPSDTGNLVVAGDLLVSAGREQVAAYADLDRFEAGEGAALRRTPPHPPALLAHGMRLFRNRRHAEAAAVLIRAAALMEAGRPGGDPGLDAARVTICRSACGHVETLIAGNDPRRLPDALEALERAVRHARRDDLRAELLLLGARAHLVLGRDVPAAVGAAQRTIEEVPDALVPAPAPPGDVSGDVAGRRALAGRVAAELIAALLAEHGRDAYRAVEARAAAALAEALRGLPPAEAGAAPADPAAAARVAERLAVVVARFPHSDAAWEAARRRAALIPAGAAGAIEQYLVHGVSSPARRAGALIAFADAAAPEAARRALKAARRIAPDIVTTDAAGARRTVREAVDARLAALGPIPPPAAPDAPLDLRAKRHRADTVPVADASRHACVPRGTSPLPSNHLLLTRGSGLLLWDLAAGAPVWKASCPKGDAGFELIDDPTADTKDGVFIYPGPAGDPARKAGLKDRDRIVRIDGVPVTAEETRRVLGAARPDAPLKLDVRRGDAVLSVTLIPGPWRAEREPFVLPDEMAWIPGGGVAVAWKDRVAVITPADGAARWVFPPPDVPAIRVEGLLASRRCVYVRYRAADAGGEEEDDATTFEWGGRRVRRPVVVGGRVFIQGQGWTDERQVRRHETRLAGLDAETGRVLWERIYPPGTRDHARLGDRVHVEEDLLVRAPSRSTLSASGDEEEDRIRQQHFVEVIDGRTGRLLGPGAAGRGESVVEAMALDREDGWLAFVRGGSELHVYDLFARVPRRGLLRIAQHAERRSARGEKAPNVALAAARGRIAVAHPAGTIEIAEPGGEAPPRAFRLVDLLGKGASRQIDPAVPGVLQWDGPDRLVVYAHARQQGYLVCLGVRAEPKALWETVETPHGSGEDSNRDKPAETVILAPTSRHLVKFDREEGKLRCFDKTREGAFARVLSLPGGGASARVRLDGERLVVESGGKITVYRK